MLTVVLTVATPCAGHADGGMRAWRAGCWRRRVQPVGGGAARTAAGAALHGPRPPAHHAGA
eukprot:215001-Chlamydomonas_euryale.AAC.1